PAPGNFGGSTTLSATLTSNGQPLANEIITFSLNGVAVATPATTNASGVATLTGVSLAGISAGTYRTGVAASFAGDGTYAHSSGTASLTVNQPTAQQQIASLVSQVTALNISGGNGMLAKLNGAIADFNAGDPNSVANGIVLLNAFINQVNGAVPQKLTSAQ